MFCPKCKAEYREGFTRCSSCDIELVNEIHEKHEKKHMKDETEIEYIEYDLVMTTFSAMDISLIKSILEDNNIAYFIQGESNVNMVGGLPARVLVKREHAEKAGEILKDCSFSYRTIL
ncbi:MAG: DUF2007 domain-containing protein [Bacillota bacterium]|nr:DUF2007 domain-containing protein [Bacillota bacterium]